MNEYMGIKCDKDIAQIDLIPVEHVIDYEEDEVEGPQLIPMQPHFGKIMECKWNNELLRQFLERFREVYPEDSNLSEDGDEIGDMFYDRLKRLKREVYKYLAKDGEEDEDVKQRIEVDEVRVMKYRRANSRRSTVSTHYEGYAIMLTSLLRSFMQLAWKLRVVIDSQKLENSMRSGISCSKWFTVSLNVV